MNESSRRI